MYAQYKPEERKTLLAKREKLIAMIKGSFKHTQKPPATSLDFYWLKGLIGKGAFGKVHLGIQVLTGKKVALKCIEKRRLKCQNSIKKVFQEVLILKKTQHQNVIRLLEVFENKQHIFFVMEYASGGDLLQLVKAKRKISESKTQPIFRQIVQALAYCHSINVLHRDIKLDNILLSSENEVLLCDFGVSRFVTPGKIIKEQCGTPAYIAPEIISGEGYEGVGADIWSLGVLLYAMLTGTVPFRANNLKDLHTLICKGEFDIPKKVSREAQNLLRRMICRDPLRRITADQILKHSWLQNMGERERIENKHSSTKTQNYHKKTFNSTTNV